MGGALIRRNFMRRFVLLLMVVSLAVSCASKPKPGMDSEGVRHRADESHKKMESY